MHRGVAGSCSQSSSDSHSQHAGVSPHWLAYPLNIAPQSCQHASAGKSTVDGRDRRRLERVCRYLLRPPFAHDAVEALTGGRVRIHFKAPTRVGSTHTDIERDAFLRSSVSAFVIARHRGDHRRARRDDRARPIFGGDHPILATTRVNLALALGHVERFDEALVHVRHAVDARRAQPEADRGNLASALESQALILTWGERFAEALAPAKEALDLRRAAEVDADLLAETQRELADVYVGLGREAEARAELQAALALPGLTSEASDLVREDLAKLGP
jgi:tetratricopeptide (TPR) repeat protein